MSVWNRPWCHYCGYLANTRDHIVPRSLGLGSGDDNIVPACGQCNSRKGSLRSDCACERCVAAWEKYAPGVDVPVIVLPQPFSTRRSYV